MASKDHACRALLADEGGGFAESRTVENGDRGIWGTAALAEGKIDAEAAITVFAEEAAGRDEDCGILVRASAVGEHDARSIGGVWLVENAKNAAFLDWFFA